MTLQFTHQEHYSRGELILRTLFGWIYILIPHGFLLFFLGIVTWILQIVSFFAILFTGKYPKAMFDFMVSVMRWQLRVNARMMNFADGYPPFGFESNDPALSFEIPYPESTSRLLTLVRLLFGWLYVMIPHGFVLFFRGIITMLLAFISWFTILILAKYPKAFFDFNVGTLRWGTRVQVYLSFMNDNYPPFNGRE